jgi:capsular polysaccharide biosynthesis protein
MELRRYFNLIRRRMALVIVAIIVGGAVGYVTTSRTPVYTATATIYVGSLDLGANQVDLYAQAGLNEVVATFAQMIPSPVIAEKAISKAHLNRFPGAVAASTSSIVIPGTNLIDVSVSDANKRDAVRLANGVSNAFVAQIAQYQTTGTKTPTTQGQVPNEPAYVFQDAATASLSSSGLAKKIVLGGLFGFVIAVLLVLLLDYLDVTIKSPEELERRVGLPVLGIVPRFDTLQLDTGRFGSITRHQPKDLHE